MLQEGGPLPGPETGLLSNIGNELSEETHLLTRQEISLVMGLVSGLSLASRLDSEALLVVHALFSQDGCQRGFWEVVGPVVSLFDLS